LPANLLAFAAFRIRVPVAGHGLTSTRILHAANANMSSYDRHDHGGAAVQDWIKSVCGVTYGPALHSPADELD